MIEWPGKMIEHEEWRTVLEAVFDKPLGTETYEANKALWHRKLAAAVTIFTIGSVGLLRALGPDRAAEVAPHLLQAAGIVKTHHKRGKNKLPPSEDKDARRKRLQYERKQRAAQLVKSLTQKFVARGAMA
jgi:hypothetical protein